MKVFATALLLALSLRAQPGDPREAHWVRLTTSDFDLYTCGGEKEGRELLRTFEQIRGFFQKASPVPLLEDFPIRVVAFNSPDQFAFYSPSGKAVAYFAPGPRTDYIVMRDPTRASYAFGVHEYMHLLIKHSGLHVPLWLNEGWADVYSTLRPVHDGVAVGDLIPERLTTLKTSPWLPLQALAAVNTESKLVSETQRIGIFYAESWALVHMLFLSPEYSPGFPKFLSALNRGRGMAEAFQSAFGRTDDEVFGDLQNYMTGRRVNGHVFEVSLGKSDQAVEFSKVDSFDVRLMLADLTIALNRRTEAVEEYEALARLRSDNMLVAEGLGFAALSIKNYEEARVNFEKAFAAGDANALMCLQLSLLEGRVHDGARVESALNRALQTKPDYVEAQFEMGLYRIALRQYPQALDALLSIKKIDPARAASVFSSIAYAYFETGDLERARANAVVAKEWATNPRQTAGEDGMLATIDARAKSPFAPHPGEGTQRVDGILTNVDCTSQAGQQRIVLNVAEKPLVLILPDLKAVETVHRGPDRNLNLTCGPQNPEHLLIDYAPSTVLKAGPAGVIRRIEF